MRTSWKKHVEEKCAESFACIYYCGVSFEPEIAPQGNLVSTWESGPGIRSTVQGKHRACGPMHAGDARWCGVWKLQDLAIHVASEIDFLRVGNHFRVSEVKRCTTQEIWEPLRHRGKEHRPLLPWVFCTPAFSTNLRLCWEMFSGEKERFVVWPPLTSILDPCHCKSHSTQAAFLCVCSIERNFYTHTAFREL